MTSLHRFAEVAGSAMNYSLVECSGKKLESRTQKILRKTSCSAK